jgi:hypothetical protein
MAFRIIKFMVFLSYTSWVYNILLTMVVILQFPLSVEFSTTLPPCIIQ